MKRSSQHAWHLRRTGEAPGRSRHGSHVGRLATVAFALLFAVLLTAPSHAHFIWLVPEAADTSGQEATGQETTAEGAETPSRVEIYFGEDAYPDDPELLSRLDALKVWRLMPEGKPERVKPKRRGDTLAIDLANDSESSSPSFSRDSFFVARQTFGVRERGEGTFLLKYYAIAGPPAGHPNWERIDPTPELGFVIRPKVVDGRVRLQAFFNGQPADEAEFRVSGPGGQKLAVPADARGAATFAPNRWGRYSIWARYIEPRSGSWQGDDYEVTRHYTTLALEVTNPDSGASPNVLPHRHRASLPTPLTSIGGAVAGDHVYIFGGTMGGSHQYSIEDQNNLLYRLPLEGEGDWEPILEGPRLQGLSMEAHDGRLIRIGGFTAMNKRGEEHDLRSQDGVAMLDLSEDELQWRPLPRLPEPRSSFDSALLDDTLYVIGGWSMGEAGERVWHETAWSLDLSEDGAEWAAIAAPPFRRRALAIAAHDGRVYAIGGITSDGETTLRTDVYDPQEDRWELGPPLPGEDPIAGFGGAAHATGGRLYMSTVTGQLFRLAKSGETWEPVGRTPTERFFHQMLPVDSERFVVVGGSNREGRVRQVEVYRVDTEAESE